MRNEGQHHTPIVDMRMMNTLEVIFLEQRDDARGDLRGVCERVSDAVARETGLLVVKGRFRLDRPIRNDLLIEGHAWNVDGNGTIVDLTASQFNKGLIESIVPGVLLVQRGGSLFERYLPL